MQVDVEGLDVECVRKLSSAASLRLKTMFTLTLLTMRSAWPEHRQDIGMSHGAISKPEFFSIELPDSAAKVLELIEVLGVNDSVGILQRGSTPCAATPQLRAWDIRPSKSVGSDCPGPSVAVFLNEEG